MEIFASWMEAERGRFALLLPVAMGAAILVYFDLPAEPPLWLGFLLPIIAMAALAAAWRYPPGRFAAALALAAALGFARAEWRTAALPPLITVPHGAAALTGTLISIDIMPNGRRILLRHPLLDGTPIPRNIRVKLNNNDSTALAPGETLSVKALLFKPDRPAYPGGWDSGRDAFFQGFGASGFALGDVTVTAAAAPDAMSTRLRALREAIAARIMAILPAATGSIAVTLLTGFQQQIPVQEHQNFIAAGLAHLLAVAGLHVGIVMGLFFAATRYLLTRSERMTLHLPVKPIAAAMALLAGAAYAALTGAHLPILRSLAMASLVTLGVIAGRRAISLRGLALAATIIMLATPEAVIGVSFQMSFSAVLALITGYAAASRWFATLHETATPARRTLAHIAGLFYTSLLAGAASMPFAAFQFQQVQPYWILANLIAVPLTAFWVLPAGLLALALMPFGLAAIALIPMAWGIGIIIWCTGIIAAWPDAMLRIPPMPNAAILCFTIGLIWLCLWRSRPRYAGIILMGASLMIYAAARPPDVLVSPDAKLIAFAVPPDILLLRQPKATSYMVSQWQPVWGGKPFATLDPAQCASGLCQAQLKSGLVLLALTPPITCPGATLVVSPQPLRGACARPSTTIIDRFTVWRDGAVAAWLTPHGVRLRSDRQVQGARPWVPPWPEWQN